MCEILIFVRNNTHTDQTEDRRGCYKRGDIVGVFEDGHVWGRQESKQQWLAEGGTAASWPGQGKFVIVKLPGIALVKAQQLLEHQLGEDDTGAVFQDKNGRQQVFRRRRWRVSFDNLPVSVRNTLSTSGEITLSTAAQRQAFRDQLKRIRDGLQYTGLD